MNQLNGKILNKFKILIIGFGSIGKKHFIAAENNGAEVYVFSKSKFDPEKLNPKFISKNEIKNSFFNLIIICSDTNRHIDDLIYFLDYGEKFIVEKPLSHNKLNMNLYSKLSKSRNIFVGFNLRYLEIINFLKDSLNREKVISIYTQFWDNCYNWYKGRDLDDVYILNKEKGGGAMLTNYHELDYIKFITSSEFKYINWLPFNDDKYSADTYSNLNGKLNNETIFNSSLWLMSKSRIRIGKAILNDKVVSWDIDKGLVYYDNKLVFQKDTDYIKTYTDQMISVLMDINPKSSTISSNLNDLKILFK